MVKTRTTRGLYLTWKLFQAHPNGFCGAIITGPRGIGKSSLALNVVWELYRELGYDDRSAWLETLDHCKFTMMQVVDFIERNIQSDDKEHVLIWDDAGVHASTMEWWIDRNTLKRLKGLLDTIRTGVCGLLITTPTESGLTKILRDYDDYIVQIGYMENPSKTGSKYRMAKGYLKRTLPSGKVMIYKKFRNKFNVMLPDWVFNRYMEMREAIHLEQIREMKKIIGE